MATDVEAHITGTVWQIEIDPGDEVSEGEDLIILESMKMEMPVESPADGTVDEILVEKDDSVEEGDVVATLE